MLKELIYNKIIDKLEFQQFQTSEIIILIQTRECPCKWKQLQVEDKFVGFQSEVRHQLIINCQTR